MILGFAYALSAGLLWGLVFIGPLLLPEYPAELQSVGRYLAFGIIAVPLAWLDRHKIRRLSRADWLEALKLAAIGNLIYYFCVASAIQRAGAPTTTIIIGTLPIVIPVFVKLTEPDAVAAPWRRLLLPGVCTIAGVICVNQSEWRMAGGGHLSEYIVGLLLAMAAVACWTWYPLRNSRWLRAHADFNTLTWATVQGVATLPLALAGYVLAWVGIKSSGRSFAMPFGPRPLIFAGIMLGLALCASWLGSACWNQASRRLPGTVAGSLVVFETLAAIAYTFILRRTFPSTLSLCGVMALVIGVSLTWHGRHTDRPASTVEAI